MKLVTKLPQNNRYFNNKDNASAHAILLIPRSVEFDVEREYKGRPVKTQRVLMDAHVFHSQADLANGTPEVMIGVQWDTNKPIANGLYAELGNLCGPFRLGKKQGRDSSYWDLIPIEEGQAGYDEAIRYAMGLVEAAERAGEAPSFDDEPAAAPPVASAPAPAAPPIPDFGF